MNDATSLKIKEELVAFDFFMTNLQGDYKKHFGALMDQLAMANDSIEKMGQIERDDANEIASLNNALEEEQETRAALEEQLESIEESQNEVNSQIIKERDLVIAKFKKLKKKRSSLRLFMQNLMRILRGLKRLTRPWKVNTLPLPSYMNNFKLN